MKRFFLLVLVFLSFVACSSNPTFIIKASTDHQDGKKVYLIKIDAANMPQAIDSTQVVEGKFSFKDSIVVPEMHYVYFIVGFPIKDFVNNFPPISLLY